MNSSNRFNRFTLSLLSSAAALAISAMPVMAQPKTGTGLDALDENRTREALASMGMEDLLERSFETGKVPQAERDGIRGLISLNRLMNQNVDKLTARQRKEIVANVSAGLDKALMSMKDPTALANLAAKLYALGVANNVALLEYWGEDTATQSQTKPAAEAVLKVYQKAEVEVTAKLNAVANQINNPGQVALMQQLNNLQLLQTTIQYTRVGSQYPLALSLDKADPKRKTLVDESIEFLKQYDNPESTIQPTIKVQIGKLLIVKGDYAGAIEKFKSLYVDPSKVTPAPKPFDLNDARFFTANAMLLSGKPDDAEKQLAETVTWQKANFTTKADLQLVTDTVEVLKARIAWYRAEQATDPADKSKFNDQASAILTKLMKENPGLKPLILEQLVSRLPPGADLKKLDTLLLQSLIERARTEYLKDKKDKFDRPTIEKGIAAAKEILSRKATPNFDKDAVNTAYMVLPFFAQKLDQPKVAAGAFLDYAEVQITANTEDSKKKAEDAWSQAMNIIVGDFKAPNVSDPEISALYDRALPMGINPPLNHREFAYAWARRQQAMGKTAEAIKYFKLVPEDAPTAINAKYYLTFALNAQLDDPKLTPANKTKIIADIQTAAAQITKTAREQLAVVTDEKKKTAYRNMLCGTILLSSRLAMDQQHDAKAAIQLLDGFEDAVKGLQDAENLLIEAKETLIRAYTESGQNDKATDVLLQYMDKRPNEAGALVNRVLQQQNKEIDAAFAKHDVQALAVLLPRRAALTGFMAKWVKENKDPKIQAQSYKYEVFDADSKRLAATYEIDPAKKKALLVATAKVYDSLIAQPQGAADPNVKFGAALTYYELGEFEKARALLDKLLRERQLGNPQLVEVKNGQQVVVDNDLYWEARLKFQRANLEIAKKNSDAKLQAEVTGELRLIYTKFGRTTGGAKWGPEFEKDRLALDPTINPDEAVLPSPTTVPSTEQAVP